MVQKVPRHSFQPQPQKWRPIKVDQDVLSFSLPEKLSILVEPESRVYLKTQQIAHLAEGGMAAMAAAEASGAGIAISVLCKPTALFIKVSKAE